MAHGGAGQPAGDQGVGAQGEGRLSTPCLAKCLPPTCSAPRHTPDSALSKQQASAAMLATCRHARAGLLAGLPARVQ